MATPMTVMHNSRLARPSHDSGSDIGFTTAVHINPYVIETHKQIARVRNPAATRTAAIPMLSTAAVAALPPARMRV